MYRPTPYRPSSVAPATSRRNVPADAPADERNPWTRGGLAIPPRMGRRTWSRRRRATGFASMYPAWPFPSPVRGEMEDRETHFPRVALVRLRRSSLHPWQQPMTPSGSAQRPLFDDPDLLSRQPVQLIHELVDPYFVRTCLPVRRVNLPLDKPLLRIRRHAKRGGR